MNVEYLDHKTGSFELDWAKEPKAPLSRADTHLPDGASPVWFPLIRQMDVLLRRRQGIFEFCHDPRCLLRVALRPAETGCRLPGDLHIQPGERVGELHFWNEHVPPIPEDGPNFAWARLIRERMFRSFALLAGSVRSDSRFRGVRAFCGKTRLGGSRSRAQFERLIKPFGIEKAEESRCHGWRERASGLGECLHLWGLLWAFNPMALAHHRPFQLSFRQVWISRRTLLEMYPSAAHPGATVSGRNHAVEIKPAEAGAA